MVSAKGPDATGVKKKVRASGRDGPDLIESDVIDNQSRPNPWACAT